MTATHHDYRGYVFTITYQAQWASNILLYQNGIKYAPQNPVVQVNLANELAAARGADTDRVRFARAEVGRIRAGLPSTW